MVHTRALLLALWALFAAGTVSAAEPDQAYLASLQQQARQLQLAKSKAWLDLVHYQPNLLGGYTSLADGPAFFNAPDGKHNPESELLATLAAFFSNAKSSKDQHPQCAFIARYHWLKQQLHFDPERLPEQTCKRFNDWVTEINPDQVTLIFPTAYMNNPSSMFGHSLIRIDQPGQDERTRLFSYAINFAAQTNESNGLLFAVLGLTGGYPGYFSIMPYYEKVKEYNDLENRDIWEYQLNLSHAEIQRLLEHAWELGPINFDYYFFDENCSYQLLALLDVARPGMELADRFPLWAIPSDTVRAILKQKGILKKAVYRPSKLTRIQHRRTYLSPKAQSYALSLANGMVSPDAPADLAPGKRAQSLELAYDYLQYRFAADELDRNKVAGRLIGLLKARSQLPKQASALAPVPIPPVRPDQGHETSRLALMGGRYKERGYAQLQLRPAYHDLLDPDGGYLPGAQINFFDIGARYYTEQDRLQLQYSRLLDIASLSPRDQFFKPISWKINVGTERLPLLDFADPDLFYTANGGLGATYEPISGLEATVMAETTVAGQDDLPVDYAIGGGGSISLLWRPAGKVKLLMDSRWQRFAGKINRNFIDSRLGLGVGMSTNLSLRLEVQTTRSGRESATDAKIGLHWYF